MERLHIEKPILVEGKYDKITLTSVLDATVIPLGGFSIFNQKEKQALIRRIAGNGGVIVLTDPDGAGRVLRGFLASILPKEQITNLYVPAVKGKERRKEHGGKAGLLGVEGIDGETLRQLFLPFSSDIQSDISPKTPITKIDFFDWGLSGGSNSAARRAAFAKKLNLPSEMSANALLAAVNLLFSKEDCEKALAEIE